MARKKKKEKKKKKPRDAMRVQLQQQSGGKTIHHHSIAIPRRSGGVRVTAVEKALNRLRQHSAIPASLNKAADSALSRAVGFAASRPPEGVSDQFSWSFAFQPQTPRESFRFDIENIIGQNLKEP